ncbi:MAG: DUF3581 family protein [Granulosicoccus sp.]
MDLSNYFSEENGAVSFAEEAASRFAKSVAGDFNPIHDPGSKRFCVPGDLLFSVLLHRYGAAKTTQVVFSGMLDGATKMMLPAAIDKHLDIVDGRERDLLSFKLEGVRITSEPFISALCEQYVKFSGQTFPDILVPLMKTANVMINPARPLVIYKDMSLSFNDAASKVFNEAREANEGTVDKQTPESLADRLTLRLSNEDTTISVDGRKGSVRLAFEILADGESIGNGEKNMVLSGLREFEEPAMQAIVDQYNQWRDNYA